MASAAFNNLGEAELKRYAACWVASEQATDWTAAHKLFDPEEKSKQASFKQVTGRMFKAYKASACDEGAEGEDDDANTAPKKKAPPKKRKVKTEETEDNAEGDGSVEPPAKKQKAPAKKRPTAAEKKAAAAATAAADAAAIAQAEAEGDEDEETTPKVEEEMD